MKEDDVIDLENQLVEGDVWEIWGFHIVGWANCSVHNCVRSAGAITFINSYNSYEEAANELPSYPKSTRENAVIVQVRRTVCKRPQAASGNE